MSLSERIIGNKKLHELVIPGATHALSSNFNLWGSHAHDITNYFLSAQIGHFRDFLPVGYRYFEMGLYQDSLDKYLISSQGFVTTSGGVAQSLSEHVVAALR